MTSRIVFACSGADDNVAAIPRLMADYAADVVAMTLDVGQPGELHAIRQAALAAGAVRAHVVDARDEFARCCVAASLGERGAYAPGHHVACALIAGKLVEIARMENASAIAHGCTATGDDQVRIDVSARAIDPDVQIIAPAREWGMTRAELVAYARARNVSVPTTIVSPYSTDQNLWGRSVECGTLDDPWNEPPDDIYTLTKSPAEAPALPAYVEIG